VNNSDIYTVPVVDEAECDLSNNNEVDDVSQQTNRMNMIVKYLFSSMFANIISDDLSLIIFCQEQMGQDRLDY